MRVKVRFRFNSATGEVEAFQVDDMRDGTRLPDHDARHERAAADVARVVEAHALIEEVAPGAGLAVGEIIQHESTERIGADSDSDEQSAPEAERHRA